MTKTRTPTLEHRYNSWGSTTQECGCQIGYSEDALWLALASWTSNEVAHLVCGENITLWDTSKLTVLNDETMYVVFSRLLLSQKKFNHLFLLSREYHSNHKDANSILIYVTRKSHQRTLDFDKYQHSNTNARK